MSVPMRYINSIIVHCSATPEGADYSASDIRAWHRSRGWRDIGYHYVIKLDGTIERGRPISQPGAHCYGHNAHSIGVCYIGGIKDDHSADTRTMAQKQSLLKLITKLTQMYRCHTFGHRDFNQAKDCPCFDAAKEYAGLYNQIVIGGRGSK